MFTWIKDFIVSLTIKLRSVLNLQGSTSGKTIYIKYKTTISNTLTNKNKLYIQFLRRCLTIQTKREIPQNIRKKLINSS